MGGASPRRQEGRHHAVEHAAAAGDRHAVVGDRGFSGEFDAAQRFAAVEHAAPAVNDQPVTRKVGGVVAPRNDLDFEFRAAAGGEQPRDLDASDVVVDRVVGAGFGDQHPVAVAQLRDRRGACGEAGDVALQPREEDREGGAGDFRRRLAHHEVDDLRIADDERGGSPQIGEGGGVFAFADDRHPYSVVEGVADRLHLREDQPSLRRLLVDRHDQHHAAAGRNEVAEQRRRFDELLRHRFDQRRLESGEHPVALRGIAGGGGDGSDAAAAFAEPLEKFGGGGRGVAAVDDGEGADLPFPSGGEEFFLGFAPDAGGGDDHQHVGAVDRREGAFEPFGAERGTVVGTGGVEPQHRTEGQEFHRLFDDVGGGAALR